MSSLLLVLVAFGFSSIILSLYFINPYHMIYTIEQHIAGAIGWFLLGVGTYQFIRYLKSRKIKETELDRYFEARKDER